MTNIEQKALALAIEVRADDKYRVCKEPTVYFALWEALCRAIEQHERFRQEVSDAVEGLCNTVFIYEEYLDMRDMLRRRFIITKPDPLVEAMIECGFGDSSNAADDIRAALAKRGLEIREKE